MLPNLAAKMEKFQEVDARLTDPSRFYAPSQTLYLQRGRLGKNLAFTVPETPIIYLRVMPTQSTAPLKRADAIDLFREGSNQLNPFYHRVSGSSSQANEFGTITFDANYDEGVTINLLWAWILTIPVSGSIAALVYYFSRLF